MRDSAHSQFIQVADLAVHSAFQAVRQAPGRAFMWNSV